MRTVSLRILLIVVSLSKAFPLLGEAVPHPRRRALADAPTETPSFVPKKVDPNGKLWVNEEHFPAEAAPMIKAIKEESMLNGLGLYEELEPGFPKVTMQDSDTYENQTPVRVMIIEFADNKKCQFANLVTEGKKSVSLVYYPQHGCLDFLNSEKFRGKITGKDYCSMTTFRFLDPNVPKTKDQKTLLAAGIKALKESGFVNSEFKVEESQVTQMVVCLTHILKFELSFQKNGLECTIIQPDLTHLTFQWAEWSSPSCKNVFGGSTYNPQKSSFKGISRLGLKIDPYLGFRAKNVLAAPENKHILNPSIPEANIEHIFSLTEFVAKGRSDFILSINFGAFLHCRLLLSKGPGDKVPRIYNAQDHGTGCHGVLNRLYMTHYFWRA